MFNVLWYVYVHWSMRYIQRNFPQCTVYVYSLLKKKRKVSMHSVYYRTYSICTFPILSLRGTFCVFIHNGKYMGSTYTVTTHVALCTVSARYISIFPLCAVLKCGSHSLQVILRIYRVAVYGMLFLMYCIIIMLPTRMY